MLFIKSLTDIMMTTKHHQVCNSISLLAFAISLFLLSSCSSYDEDITEIEITFTDEARISFGRDGGSKIIEVKSNKDWSVVKGADASWIEVSPTNGLEGAVSLTVSVESNDGNAREGFFTIIAAESEKTITVTQHGKDGSAFEYTTIREIRSLYTDSGQNQLRITQPLKLKGVVISDAEGGNNLSSNEGFMQDEAGGGIAFRVADQALPFDTGDRLYINLAGSTVSNNNGVLQLNFSTEQAKVQAQDVVVTPKELSIEEVLGGSYDATLVKIMNAQFRTFENLSYYESKGSATNRALESNKSANIIVRTSKSATFKDEPLPAGKGNIVGIVSQVNGAWSIAMRNLDDAREMSTDASTRFVPEDPPTPPTKISIATLRGTIGDGEAYDENNYIEGEVILNTYKANVTIDIVYIADESAGVAFLFTDKENILTNLPIGSKVKVQIKGAKAKVFEGLLQIGADNSLATKAVEIIDETVANPLLPKVATIEEIRSGKYQSELVRIENVQFMDLNAKYVDDPSIINEAKQELQIFTRKEATFAYETVKQGMGSIVAVVSIFNSPHLLIRSTDDLNDMTGKLPDDSSPFIVTDKAGFTFDNWSGEETINIKANVDWTAKSDESWLTISPRSGSNNGSITASATENGGNERRAIITITGDGITKTVQVTQKREAVDRNAATDLFFSEYIEGASNNKYLEIYNGTGRAVDLSDYQVELYVNGQKSVKSTEVLTGTLADGDVIVLQHSKAEIYNGEAIISSALNFNGNDAIALVKISTADYIDIIGCIGHDPGKKGWIDPYDDKLTTFDKTLIRKPSVRGGVTINPYVGFPTLGDEWISYPVDTADYLGGHIMD